MALKTLTKQDFSKKAVVLRLDLNVPMQKGEVSDLTRLVRVVPTVRALLEKGANIRILSHFDRPKGKVVPELSLKPLQGVLSDLFGVSVGFIATDWREELPSPAALEALEQILLFENTRFHPGEEANDSALARKMASLGDVFVNDAFSAAHRAHASTEGIAHFLPALAGKAMEAELLALQSALETPKRPVLAVVGGAKISSKLEVLRHLVTRVETLIVGGAMANTFLAAQGFNMGDSLQERDLEPTAREILGVAKTHGCTVLLPEDVVVAPALAAGVKTRICEVGALEASEKALDIGPRSLERMVSALKLSKTVLWNGPLGAFETSPFDQGTTFLARAVADQTQAGAIRSVAGGGDTVAALEHAGVLETFSYVSTAGGAFLEWLEGRTLPGLVPLYDA